MTVTVIGFVFGLFSRCFDAGSSRGASTRVPSRSNCCVTDGPSAWDLLAFFLGVVVILGEVVYMGVVISSGRGDLLGVVISPGVLSAAVPRLQGLGAFFRCKIFFGYKMAWVPRRLPTICHNQWADQLLGTTWASWAIASGSSSSGSSSSRAFKAAECKGGRRRRIAI